LTTRSLDHPNHIKTKQIEGYTSFFNLKYYQKRFNKMNNKRQKEYKRRLLIRFINIYLSKPNLKMKDLMKNLIISLNTKGRITPNQFNAIYKFIQRERPFKTWSEQEILNYFSPLIVGKQKESSYDTNTFFE
jgi:hypothetical protein